MFVVNQSGTYFWPVSFKIPVDDGQAEMTFSAKFKRLTTAEAEKLALDCQLFYRAAELGYIDDDTRRPVQMAKDVLVGWRDVRNAEGDDIPFTEESLAEVMSIHGCALGVMKAWQESLSGGRVKN
jgi:hypothetical protein